MAFTKFSLVLLLACSCTLSQQGVVLAEIICENLATNVCAFSISSTGKRCLLENSVTDNGKVEYQCKTSEVVVGGSTSEYLETDACVSACGVDRKSVGMSSDALLEPTFTSKLCSPACFNNCPNLVDLYFNLAAGEGVYLPEFCERQRTSLRRDMAEVVVEEESDDNALAPAGSSSRRNMVELQSDGGALAPAASADDVPAQQRVPRRVMVELLSSGGAVSSGDDDLVADAPTPSSPLDF